MLRFLKVFMVASFLNPVWASLQVYKTHFELVDAPSEGLDVIGSKSVQSLVACGVWCLSAHSTCRCFLHNNSTKICIAGTQLSTSFPPPSASDDAVYVITSSDHFPCPIGYFDYTHNGLMVCVAASAERCSYDEAVEKCMGIGGHIFTPKTPAKYQLMKELMKDHLPIIVGQEYSSALFIGLTSKGNPDNVYRWEDDNSALDSSFQLYAFHPGDPYSSECGIMMYDQVLGDRSCSQFLRYFCEYS